MIHLIQFHFFLLCSVSHCAFAPLTLIFVSFNDFLSHCPFFMMKCKVQCSALLTRWENNCLMFYMFASPAPDGQSVDFAICFQTQKISWSRVSYKLLSLFALPVGYSLYHWAANFRPTFTALQCLTVSMVSNQQPKTFAVTNFYFVSMQEATTLP